MPSVALLEGSMGDDHLSSWLADLTDILAASEDTVRPILLGVSDSVPPDADLERLGAIAERVNRAR